MPTTFETSLLSATARIALPSLVFFIKRKSKKKRIMAVRIIIIWKEVIVTIPKSKVWLRWLKGKVLVLEPNNALTNEEKKVSRARDAIKVTTFVAFRFLNGL